MIKIFKYFFYSIFLSIFIAITLALIFIPEDQAWIDCSDEKDLYRYVYDGWKVDKVLKNGDITFTDTGQKLYYKGEYPQIQEAQRRLRTTKHPYWNDSLKRFNTLTLKITM